MLETPTVQQPTPAPQPPMYPLHPYQEYAAPQQPYYGPPVPPPKKKMGTGTKWLIGILVFLVVALGGGTLAYIGSLANKPANPQQATPAPTQKPTTVVPTPQVTPKPSAEEQYKASANTMTVTELVVAGNSHQGEVVHIQGTVEVATVTDQGTSGMIVSDPVDSSQFVIVIFPDGMKMDIFHPRDKIEIWGRSLGTTDSNGQTVSGMSAVYFTDATSGYKV